MDNIEVVDFFWEVTIKASPQTIERLEKEYPLIKCRFKQMTIFGNKCANHEGLYVLSPEYDMVKIKKKLAEAGHECEDGLIEELRKRPAGMPDFLAACLPEYTTFSLKSIRQ